jgi:phosphoribosyl-AMP cyclohydrolase
MSDTSLSAIRWQDYDLIPAVVQDAGTRQVLMVGFMNQEAFRLTRETDRVHFFSRSRGAMWRKGETSGNELVVEEMRVNCEQNSLLVLATPLGPTCHEGYETCYFRRIEPDGNLTVLMERAVDPETIYGSTANQATILNDPTRLWYRAYEYLRDNDLSSESGTSKRLHETSEPLSARLADELGELAGVLTGEHGHQGLISDVLLEGSQTIYWTALIAVRDRISWSTLRPDRALATSDEGLKRDVVARMLRGDAALWREPLRPSTNLAARCHATLALIAQACAVCGVEPSAILQRDLDDLRTREYLAPLFEEL